MIGVILTITSILFGFLSGFFISELWTRYTEIRELVDHRSADGLSMIEYAKHFFNNKKFQQEFKKSMEKSSIADEIVEWNETNFAIPYFREAETPFKYIRIKNQKDSAYFEKLLDNYHDFVEATVRLDTLGKDRLFPSEWFLIILLSIMILFSILSLDISHFFYKIIILLFPPIIILALSIIYDLDTLYWSKEIVSLEPNQRIFDALGVKRFYQKIKKPFISKHIKNYRTEDDLKGELKQVHLDILKIREQHKT